MNNLALLTNIKLDNLSVLQKYWKEQYTIFKDINVRYTCTPDDFIPYFKNLLIETINEIDLPYKNIIIQNTFDHNKKTLRIAHKDKDRASCLTICLSEIIEPVCFYSDFDINNRKLQKLPNPKQISTYSHIHPVLVNVQNIHRVHLIEGATPRILLQISYDQSFDDIINHKKEIWKLL